jgi:hypothetical protein
LGFDAPKSPMTWLTYEGAVCLAAAGLPLALSPSPPPGVLVPEPECLEASMVQEEILDEDLRLSLRS